MAGFDTTSWGLQSKASESIPKIIDSLNALKEGKIAEPAKHMHKSSEITDASSAAFPNVQPNSIVKRDASGNFGANTIYASKFVNMLPDFILGVSATDRGDSGSSIALAKLGSSDGKSLLGINHNNCFSAGTYVNSKLIVEQEIDAKKGILVGSAAADIWGSWRRCITLNGGISDTIFHNASKLFLGFNVNNDNTFYFGKGDTQEYYGYVNKKGWNGNVVGNATTASGLLSEGNYIFDVDAFYAKTTKIGCYRDTTANIPPGYGFGTLINFDATSKDLQGVRYAGHAQLAISHQSDVHVRGGWNGAFHPWVEVLTADHFTQSFATNGYTKLPNGLILQWGGGSYGASSTTDVTCPTACPNKVVYIGIQTATATPAYYVTSSKTGFRLVNGPTAQYICWSVIGY